MKLLTIFCFCLILGCGKKGITVYVHHESLSAKTFNYNISIAEKKMLSDSIQFTGIAPNFNDHFFERAEGVLKLSVDAISKQIVIKNETNFYSFFILSDTSGGVMKARIIVKAHEKKPRFY